ncbi:MAG: hypothetical protein HYX94_05865 [Chloroflexi bacterium]|nr:hypothetical protein [Chloroflexota bacterium]
MGIIDTLSAGFSTVNRRLWVLAIPIVLDLFLWLGPKLTAAGPIQRFFGFWADATSRSSSELLGQVLSSPEQADAATQIAKVGEDLRNANLFNVLAWQPPSLMYDQVANAPAGLPGIPVWGIDRGLVLVGIVLGLAVLSLAIQSAYLSGIAQGIAAGESRVRSLGGAIAVNWLRLMAYFAMLVGLAFLAGMPAVIVIGLTGLISPVLSGLMGGLLLAVLLWAALYLFFAVAAMFVSDVGPARGAWYSLSIVRRNFWSALGLIILILVIRLGLSKIWAFVLGHPAGVTVAILGHAYIDAGLAAASMIFFRDRFLKWREASQSSKPVAERI